jgi:hypothetical protein
MSGRTPNQRRKTMRHRLWPLLSLAVATLGPSGALGAQPQAAPPQVAPGGLPSRGEAQAVCRMVAARGLAVQSMLVEKGELDANNDGVPDDVTVAEREGTMRGEDLAFRPRGAAKDSKPVDVTPKDFQFGDYFPFGARWLPYGGRVYTLYFEAEDERYPTHLGYIDKTNTEHLLCDFDHRERETFRPVRATDAALCRAVARGRVDYVKVAEARDADADAARRRWSSRVAGHVSVDFANTGRPTSLALVALESGAGRGCALDYFDLIVGGELARSGDDHGLLMKLQDVELSDQGSQDYTSGRCDGSTPRWFARNGLTYIDIAGGPDVRGMEPFHELRLLRKNRVATLCKGTFAVSWTIKSMGPEFR